MAHNCLHEIIHKAITNRTTIDSFKKTVTKLYKDYMKELKDAKYISSLPA